MKHVFMNLNLNLKYQQFSNLVVDSRVNLWQISEYLRNLSRGNIKNSQCASRLIAQSQISHTHTPTYIQTSSHTYIYTDTYSHTHIGVYSDTEYMRVPGPVRNVKSAINFICPSGEVWARDFWLMAAVRLCTDYMWSQHQHHKWVQLSGVVSGFNSGIYMSVRNGKVSLSSSTLILVMWIEFVVILNIEINTFIHY